ncbi:MAG: SPFH domain-containing protein [Chloroflexi bacterium]|nr:SPFH domain-containing protein [Chloroflexota bacterium]
MNSRTPGYKHTWFTWILVGLFLAYLPFVWFLERPNLEMFLPPWTDLRALILALIKLGRHLIPIVVGWWFAYQAAVYAVKVLYDLPDQQAAQDFLSALKSPDGRYASVVSVNDATLEDDRFASVVLRVGGPGKVKVDGGNVAVIEINGRFSRVLSQGTHRLRPFEFVHMVLDTRLQERQETDVPLRTRDNIDLTASFSITYRLRRGDVPATKNRPFPFAETAVRTAAYTQTVLDEGKVSNWDSKPVLTTKSKLGAAVAKYKLDEILHPAGQGEEPYRTLQNEVLRAARSDLHKLGIELLSVHIDRLDIPSEVEDLYIRYWRSQWESQNSLRLADGEATAVEELEIARSEAEVAITKAIIESIQQAKRTGAITRTSDIVALRLVEALERMARKTQQAQVLLPLLENTRNELAMPIQIDQSNQGVDDT